MLRVSDNTEVMVDISPSLTRRHLSASGRSRIHSGEARSLPNSPFIQRRVGTPSPSKKDGDALELPLLSVTKQMDRRHQGEEIGDSSPTSAQETSPRYEPRHNDTDSHSLSPFVSPSLRRKVLRKRNGLAVQLPYGDGETSDESRASGSPRMLSPASSIQETCITLETVFSNVENKPLGPASPMIQRRVRQDNFLPRTDNDYTKFDVGHIISRPRSLMSSPMSSPMQSPGLSRRVIDSHKAAPPSEPAVHELTLENVKAFETIANDNRLGLEDNTGTGSSDRQYLHNADLHRHNNPEHDAHRSRRHQHSTITAKLTVGNLTTAPVLQVPGEGAPNKSTGGGVVITDLQRGQAADDEQDGEESAAIRRCQEWLTGVHVSPTTAT
ncbi:uncharacterized protein [Ptychodera flava]|uniref:uncharacterized protein n=1 Tax=Ptychodera flava TaxID=63121 RepID=UPI00396A179E